MAEAPKRSARDDVESLLDGLDDLSKGRTPTVSATAASPSSPTKGTTRGNAATGTAGQHEDAQSVLDFLDEITQRSSTPTTSIPTKKTQPSTPLGSGFGASTASLTGTARPQSRASGTRTPVTTPRISVTDPVGRKSIESPRSATRTHDQSSTTDTTAIAGAGGWGWGSVFKQATTVLQQAKTVAEQAKSVAETSDLVKHLNQNLQQQIADGGENAKKWSSGVVNYVKTSGIDQIGKDLQATGLKSLTDIMNAVAPPIAEHEIIEVLLSYDMIGYDGIENLVYRSLSKIMEQVDGGDLVLNRGHEEKPKEVSADDPQRDLQAVDGMMEGYKLAHANLDSLIKIQAKAEDEQSKSSPDQANQLPITRCPIFVRIQPILSTLPVFASSAKPVAAVVPEVSGDTHQATPLGMSIEQERHLVFLLLLRDPNNALSHATLTQTIPASWLDIPFEENEWVEDIMVDVIRRGTEVIGQQYVNGRVTGRSIKNARASLDGQSTLDGFTEVSEASAS